MKANRENEHDLLSSLRTMVSHESGHEVIETEKIIYCEVANTQTAIYMEGVPSPKVLNRSISDMEAKLKGKDICLINRSNIINLMHLVRIMRGRITRVLLKGDKDFDVSDKYKKPFLDLFANW